MHFIKQMQGRSRRVATGLDQNISGEETQSPSGLTKNLDKRALLWLCLGCLAFYILIGQGFITGQGYEQESFYTARNIVEHGDFTVYGQNPPTYPRNGFTEAVVLVPWYLFTKIFRNFIPSGFEKEWLISWYNPIFTTLTVAYIYLFILKLGMGRTAALTGSLMAAVTSMLVPYSQIGMEPFLGLTLIMAVYYLYAFSKSGKLLDMFWAGIASGLVMGAKQISAPLLLPLGLYTLYILHQKWKLSDKNFWQGLGIWLVPVLLSTAQVIWFYSIRGSGNGSIMGFTSTASQVVEFRLIGLYSYLFSLNRSIFVYSPTLILVLFAAGRFWKEHKPEFLLFSAIAGIGLGFPALTLSYMDEVWGPRYVYMLVPFGYIVIASLFQPGLKLNLWKKGGLAGLCLLGAFVQFLGSIYWYIRYVQVLTVYGISASTNYSEIVETSPVAIHFQLFISNLNRLFFNTPTYLDYRVIYSSVPNPAPALEYGNFYPKLKMPKIDLSSYADIQQWFWKVFSLPAGDGDSKIVAGVIVLLLLGLISVALWQIRKIWIVSRDYKAL